MYRVLTCLVTEHDWRLVVLAGAICCVRQRGRHQPVSSCQGLAWPNARDLDLPRRGCRRLRNLGHPFRRDAGLRSRRRRRIQHTRHAFVPAVRGVHCRHRPLRCTVQCAPVGRCDRRRDHRRRCRGDALYRHGGARASGLHCLGARYRCGFDRFRKRVRGHCDARRRASRRFCPYPGRRRPADGRNRFTSFHGDGRRHARSRSDARLRRADGFSGRAFVSDVCRRLCHSRHIAAGGHVRSPRKGRTP